MQRGGQDVATLSLSTFLPPQDVNFALTLAGSALTRGVGHGVPGVLCTSAGTVVGRGGAQASWGGEAGQPQGTGSALGGAGEGLLTPIVVMGSHQRAARRDGCHTSGPARSGDLSKTGGLVTAQRSGFRIGPSPCQSPGFRVVSTSSDRLRIETKALCMRPAPRRRAPPPAGCRHLHYYRRPHLGGDPSSRTSAQDHGW